MADTATKDRAGLGETPGTKPTQGELGKAQKAVDGAKVAGDKVEGWVVYHAQPALTADNSPTGRAMGGDFRAHKRDGNTLMEAYGMTADDLARSIAANEAGRVTTEPSAPTEEQLMNDAKATLHLSITSGARPAIDVDLTPAATKAEPKAKRLAASPPIEEIKLDKETQAGIAAGRPGADKVTNVGTGQ